MYERQEIIIPLDDLDDSGWTLRIVRENNSDHVEFHLHWKDKVTQTHSGSEPIDQFKVLLNRLLDPQVST